MTGTTRTLARHRTGVRRLGLLVLLVAAVTAAAPGVIRIRPGDTLSELALRHHTTVAALQAANHLHGTMIYAGQLLTLPGNATPSAPTVRRSATVARSYTVRTGDTLIGLAQRFGTTPRALAARNHLRGTVLLLGQRLTYVERVTVSAPAGPARLAPGVAASAARHRAVLASRSLPGRAAVEDLIRTAARRHHVPVDLALALAWQESGFQQRVVSPVDAIGVMQVLPGTARSLGRIHGRSFDLLKASDNVDAGVWLLRDLLDATGSAPGAMAGYYQGLGSVARIGLLPETHAYIRNITLLRSRFR